MDNSTVIVLVWATTGVAIMVGFLGVGRFILSKIENRGFHYSSHRAELEDRIKGLQDELRYEREYADRQVSMVRDICALLSKRSGTHAIIDVQEVGAVIQRYQGELQ